MIKCDFEYQGLQVKDGYVRISAIGLENTQVEVTSIDDEKIKGKVYQVGVQRYTSYTTETENTPLPGVLYFFIAYEEGVEAMKQCYSQLMTQFENAVEV